MKNVSNINAQEGFMRMLNWRCMLTVLYAVGETTSGLHHDCDQLQPMLLLIMQCLLPVQLG